MHPADGSTSPAARRGPGRTRCSTSNKSLTEWGRVLHNSALAAALADRLQHHGEVYYLKGDSYCLRGKPRPADSPRIRCDWGPQYIADAWIDEVRWLGCTISPSYVGEPECNGIAERFTRTLKEQCIYVHQFANLEEARRIIHEFIDRYNTQ